MGLGALGMFEIATVRPRLFHSIEEEFCSLVFRRLRTLRIPGEEMFEGAKTAGRSSGQRGVQAGAARGFEQRC